MVCPFVGILFAFTIYGLPGLFAQQSPFQAVGETANANECERNKLLECVAVAKGASLDHPQTKKNFLIGVLPKSQNEFVQKCENAAKYDACLQRNNLTQTCLDDPWARQLADSIKFMCEQPQKSGMHFYSFFIHSK